MTKFSYSLFTYYLKSGWPKFPDFDRVYTNDMVKDHQKVAAGHQKEQGQVKDPQLMTYLDNTLRVVQSHLRMAKEIKSTTTSP